MGGGCRAGSLALVLATGFLRGFGTGLIGGGIAWSVTSTGFGTNLSDGSTSICEVCGT